MSFTHKLLTAAFTVGLVASLTTVASADNLQNDVVVGGNDTTVTGVATTVRYRITANNGDGENGCNASTASPATVTINAPAGVTSSPATLTFISCGTQQPVALSSAVAGDYEITASMSDSGAGSYNLNPAKFTLHVNTAPPVTPTNTKPTVSVVGVIDGSTHEIGSEPSPSCSVTDAEDVAPIVAAVVIGGTLAHGLGSLTATCNYTDQGGLVADTATATYTIVDTGNPTITHSVSPTANTNGWSNQDVTVTFDCADAGGSGIASCLADGEPVGFKVLGEGENQSVSGTATDWAGNTATDTASGINVDKTDPTVSLVNAPPASYYFGNDPAAPTCEASDSLSGIEGSCVVSGGGTSVGTHSYTATATDEAGNQATATSSYTVLAWTLTGFYQPVDMNGVLNTVKGGSTVPLKFEVFAGTTELSSTAAIASFKTMKVTCGTTTGIEDAIEVVSTGGTSLRYDSTGGQFIQNWKTPTGAGTCYSVTMTTADGSSITALFKLK